MKGQMVEWSEAFDAIEEGVAIIDTEHNILRANKAFANLVGVPQNKLEGRKCYDVVHGTDTPPASCPFRETLKTKKIASAELKEPHLGEGTFLLTASPVLDDKGRVKWTVLKINDITERKKAEEELKRSHQTFKFLAEYNELTSGLTVDAIVHSTLEFLRDTLGLKESSIAILNSDQDSFYLAESIHSKKSGLTRGFSMPVHSTVLSEVVKQHQPRYRPDIAAEDSSYVIDKKLLKAGQRSDFLVPLWIENICLGTLNISKPDIDGFAENERQLIALLAPRLAQALQNARLFEALRKSEEKYRGISDESIATVYVFDEKKNFIDSNPAGLDLLGYSKAELLTMSIPDVDADPIVVLPAHEQLLSGERIINYEHKLKKKDGTIITVLNNSKPLTDVDGSVVGMQSTLIDITERKQAERALRESVEKYRTLIESSSDCICHIDLDGRFIYMNPGGVKLNELESFGEIRGLDCATAVKEEYKALMQDALNRAKNGETVGLEYESTTAKGRDRWWGSTISPIKDDKGRVISLLRISRDITEHKAAESEVQRSREFLDRVIEGSADAIVTTDSNGIVTTWSRGAEELYGFSAEEVLGKPVHILYPKEFSDERRKWQKKITEGHTLYNLETKIYTKEGELRDISLSLSPLKDNEGRIAGTVGVSKDITEIKRINAEMRKKVRELEKWYNLTVDRELKMVELKDKIKELEEEIERLRGAR